MRCITKNNQGSPVGRFYKPGQTLDKTAFFWRNKKCGQVYLVMMNSFRVSGGSVLAFYGLNRT